MTKRIGVYAGSFDPIHYGHLDILNRSCELFDEIHVVIAVAPGKSGLFVPERRKGLIQESIVYLQKSGKATDFTSIDASKIKVEIFTGLMVKYVEDIFKSYHDEARDIPRISLVRGIRNVADLDPELTMATYNMEMGVDTILLPTHKELSHLSSSGIKVVAGHDIRRLEEQDWVTPPVYDALFRKAQSAS